MPATLNDVLAAYLANNKVGVDEIPNVVAKLRAAIEVTETTVGPAQVPPAVAIDKSITDTYIICLEDGKKLRTMKRYLMTHYKMTPDQYRVRWGLPRDYPMTAPEYSRRRQAQAAGNPFMRKAK